MAAPIARELVIPAHRESNHGISFPLYGSDGAQTGLGSNVAVFILRAVDGPTTKLVVRSDGAEDNVLTVDSPGSETTDVELSLTIDDETFVNADVGRYEAEICIDMNGELHTSNAARTPARIVSSAVVA